MHGLWKPVTEPPEKSGYVLIAGYHHGVPKVLYGYCRSRSGSGESAYFKEDTYHGQGMAITHWMPLPEHPLRGVSDDARSKV